MSNRRCVSNRRRMLTTTKIMATRYKDKTWIELLKKNDLKILDKSMLIIYDLFDASSDIKNKEDYIDCLMYGLVYLNPEVETRIRSLKYTIDKLVNTCDNFKEDNENEKSRKL